MTTSPGPLVSGPRDAALRGRIRDAVLALLDELTYADLTYERVAAASGVAKTTLYRHWPTKAELVFDLVLHDRPLPGLDDRGTAEADVAALAERLCAFVAQGPARRVFAGVVADVQRDPAVRERFRTAFITPAQPMLLAVLDRIAARTGRPRTLSVEDFQATLIGAVLCWTAFGDLDHDDLVARTTALVGVLSGARC